MENKELETILKEMKEQKTGMLSKELFETLRDTVVSVPVIMPEDTDPEVLEKIFQSPGQIQEIPEGVHPQPCILENEKHEKYLPVFTSEEELDGETTTPQFSLFMNIKFSACLDFIYQHRKDIGGVVINAYTHNLILQLNEQKKAQPETIQVPVEEFHRLMRNKMEGFHLPKKLFTEKEEAVSRLCKEQGAYMKELYEELYTTEVACPYTEEDFEFMSLNISEDLVFIQMIMPKKYLMINTCPSVFAAWDRKEQKIWYYAIVVEGPEKGIHLHQLQEDGKDTDLGAAPAEGSELSTILNLIQKES